MKIDKAGKFVETVDIDKAIELYNSGMSMGKVSKQLNISKPTLSYAFKRHDVVTNKSHTVISKLSKDEIVRHLMLGRTKKEVSQLAGISVAALNKRLVNIDIIKPTIERVVAEAKQLTMPTSIDELMPIIVGIFLGDASISKEYEYIKPHLEYGHAADQLDLVKIVYKLLLPIMGNGSIRVKAPSKNTNEDTFYRIRTNIHDIFSIIRNKYYTEGFFPNGNAIKRFDEELLKWMDERSLVLFYLDDGYHSEWNDKGVVGFCTDNFHRDDVDVLIRYLKTKFDISCYKQSSKPHLLTGFKTLVHQQSIEKFERILLKYIPKSMRSKFPGVFVPPPWDVGEYTSEFDKIDVNNINIHTKRLPSEFKSGYSITSVISTLNADDTKNVVEYTVSESSRVEVGDFLEHHHYLGRPPHHAKYYFKLVANNTIVGAAAFAGLRVPAVTNNLFSIEVDAKSGLDVSRFACIDECGKNTESFFLSKCMDGIKQIDRDIKFLVTYAQPELGHQGYVYQATNWIYVSDVAGAKVKYYLDGKPTTRAHMKNIHPNMGRTEWKQIYDDRIEYRKLPSKHKYIFILDASLKKHLSIPYIPYPKA